MTRRIARLSLVALLGLLLAAGLAAGLFTWRLNSGPVPLAFLTGTVEHIINATLGKSRVEISDAVIERDAETGKPHLRLRNIAVYDENGTVIARAPRAAVGLNLAAIFTGHLAPDSLELIGPRIMLRRKLDGSLDLGFGAVTGDQPTPAAQPEPQSQPGSGGKSDLPQASGSAAAPPPAQDNAAPGIDFAHFINRDLLGPPNASAMAGLSGIMVSDASISLYDERNQAVWYAPRVNLAFKRASYGFALFADAAVASGKTPWRTEVAAHYRQETHRFAVTARVFDLVPADLADQVFALSQLAQVRLPLSGQADLEITDAGQILSASAELIAKPGVVNFPDYIAQPVEIGRGSIKLAYDPGNGDINLVDSSVDLGGADTALTGKMEQVRDDTGLLQSLRLTVAATNRSPSRKPDDFTSFRVKGSAFIRDGRFDVDEFALTAGKAQLALHGSFREGRETAGIQLSGQARELPANLVKRLWPPIIAPNSRRWVYENVSAGRVPTAQIAVDLPAGALAAAMRHEPLPDAAVDLSFTLADISTKFLEAAPPITGASGQGHVSGTSLALSLGDGKVTLASGRSLSLVKAQMTVSKLSQLAPPAVFRLTATGKADGALELLDLPPMGYTSAGGLKPANAGGDVTANVEIAVPLHKGLTAPEISVKATGRIANASLANSYPGLTLSNGAIDVSVDSGNVTVGGDLKVNGMPARLAWSRAVQPDGAPARMSLALDAELDDAARAKLNPALNAFVRGPVGISIRTVSPDAKLNRFKVEADISRATLHFDPIRWTRPVNGKANMSFEADMTDPSQTVIKDLAISGQKLDVKGSLTIGPGGTLQEASLPNITLDPMNAFSVQIKRQSGTLGVKVRGARFDARGLVNTIFQRTVIPPGADLPVPISIEGSVATLYANRGETVQDVSLKMQTLGSFIKSANMTGTLMNGSGVTFTITPDKTGTRIMRVGASDGGGVLRAANLYSKIAGGVLDFYAELGSGNDTAIRRGQVTLRDFEIRNEAALAEIDRQGRVRNTRRGDGLAFERFTMPFTADADYVRIGDSMMRGPELGASATGTIRKADGAIDIGGTIIPAYALNSVVSRVPLLGPVIAGGRGQGIFGLNFALRGTMDKPRFVVNPLSAVAPGFLRRFFEIGGGGVNPDGTPTEQAPPVLEPKN